MRIDRADWLQQLGQRYALVLVGVGVVFYSIGPVLISASDASGPVMSFWRLWFGVPLLGVAAFVGARHDTRGIGWRGWRWAIWAGVAFGAHQLLFFSALKLVTVTDVVLMNVLAPVVVGVAAVPLFGERASIGFRGWSLVAMAGAAIVVTGGVTGPQGSAAGMAMALANVGAFAAFFLLSKLARGRIPVLPFLAGAILVAAVAVTSWCLVVGEPVGDATAGDLVIALVVAAGPGAVGHFVMTWPLPWVPANVPPVMRLAQPVLAGFLAWSFLSQPVTLTHVAGGLLTLLGVVGAVRRRPSLPPPGG